jgi:hypothetical protein
MLFNVLICSLNLLPIYNILFMNINPIKNALYKYNSLKQNLSFIKKKNKFIVIDGYIKYQINKTNLTCPCSKYLCEHIIYFVINIIGINIDNLIFFNKFKEELINCMANETDFVIINQNITKIINKDCECIICMCNLQESKINKNIIECYNCLNYCHKYCFDLYKSKNGLFLNTCIYCKSADMI